MPLQRPVTQYKAQPTTQSGEDINNFLKIQKQNRYDIGLSTVLRCLGMLSTKIFKNRRFKHMKKCEDLTPILTVSVRPKMLSNWNL
jgi:hypothetical protein